MSGGAHRGPVALRRQTRTIRLMQGLLVLLAAGLLLFAGYSLGLVAGFDAGRRAGDLETPRRPSLVQTIVLGAAGAGALVGALLMQGEGGVRVPTPARLDELSGRAEQVAVTKAEEIASRSSSAGGS